MKKTHLSKRALSIMMALLMVITSVPLFALPATADSPQVTTRWTEIASTDFTKTTWTGTQKAATSWYYRQDGDQFKSINNSANDAVIWQGYNYSGDHHTFDKTANGAQVNNGFMYINGWNKDGVSQSNTPITGTDAFKIDLEFSFYGNYTLDSNVKKNCFIKIKTDNYSTESYPWQNQWYAQTGYGSMYVTGNGENSPAISRNASTASIVTKYYKIATDNNNISANTNYHYILTYSHQTIRAYITDTNGTVVVNFGSVPFSGNTNNIKGLFIGAATGSHYYYQNLCYKNITFYSGTETTYSPESDNTSDTKYLFAYFNDNTQAGEKLRFAVSTDGKNWESINGGANISNVIAHEDDGRTYANGLAVYPAGTETSYAATGHLRDPYVLKKHDGSGYYILATDLDCDADQNGRPDWNESKPTNNSKIYVWDVDELTDISTTNPWYIDVTELMDGVYGAENTTSKAWAPEAIWDTEKNAYMLVFSSSCAEVDHSTRMYYIYTTDFQTFENNSAGQKYAELLLPHVSGVNIDGNITYDNGLYYLWYKDETSGVKIGYSTAEHANGPYGCFNAFSDSNYGAFEGPEVYYNTQDEQFIMFADNFDGASYISAYENDSVSGFTAENKLADNTVYNIAHLIPRHGSVVRISDAEYNALISTYGRDVVFTSNVDSGHSATEYLIARYFTAENPKYDASGHKNHLDSANMTMETYNDKYAAVFTGGSKSGTVNTASMASGLTAKAGITFDWYGYGLATTNSTAHFFDWGNQPSGTVVWGTGNANNHTNSNYIYASNGIKFGVYQGAGSDDGDHRIGNEVNMGTSNLGAWHRYTMVISEGWIEIYIDGVLYERTVSVSSQTVSISAGTPYQNPGINEAVISSLSHLSFGDSSWGADDDFTGAISDFRIYNRALTIADVTSADAALAAVDVTTPVTAFYDPMENLAADSNTFDGTAKKAYTTENGYSANKTVTYASYPNVLDISGGVVTYNGSGTGNAYYEGNESKDGAYIISFWYNPGTSVDSDKVIFNIGQEQSDNIVDDNWWGNGNWLAVSEGGVLNYHTQWVSYATSSMFTLTASTWSHIVIKITPNGNYDTVTAYVNGESQTTVNTSSLVTPGTNDLPAICTYLTRNHKVYYGTQVIDWNGGYRANSDGYIDEFRITQGEVDAETLLDQDSVKVAAALIPGEIATANTNISNFETLMSGNTTIYKNMKNAYDAYVKLHEIKDAITYGGQNDITAYRALQAANADYTTKVAAMTVWSEPTATAKVVYFDDTNTSTSKAAQVTQGVMYVDNTKYANGTDNTSSSYKTFNTDSGDVGNWGSEKWINGWIVCPEAVIMYDGITKPHIPVALSIANWKDTTTRHWYDVYPTTTGFKLNNTALGNSHTDHGHACWFGDDSTRNFNYSSLASGNCAIGGRSDNDGHWSKGVNKNNDYKGNWHYVNILEYDPSTDPSATVTKVNINWAGHCGEWKTQSDRSKQDFRNVDATVATYIVNYKTFKEEVDAKAAYIRSVSGYSEGGLATTFTALDTATAIDFATLSATTSTILNSDGLKGKMDTAEGLLTSATITADGAQYPAVRTALKTYNVDLDSFGDDLTAEAILADPDIKATTVEGYDAFVTAYNNAKNHMAGLLTNHYYDEANAAAVNTLATNLKNAMDALSVIDRSAFNGAVEIANEAVAMIKVYTAATRDTLAGVVSTQNPIVAAATTQATVDGANTAVRTAYNSLAYIDYTVTFNQVVNGSDTTRLTQYTMHYGDTAELDYREGDYQVVKWDCTIDGTTYEFPILSNYLCPSVIDDATYNIYVTDGAPGTAEIPVVTMMTKTGNVCDMLPIPADTYSISSVDNVITFTQVLPEESEETPAVYTLRTQAATFYNVSDYLVNGESILGTELVLSEDITINPVYTVKSGKSMTVTYTGCYNVYNPDTIGRTIDTKWDDKITVTAEGAGNSTAWYNNGELVAFGEEYVFRASQTAVITCSTETNTGVAGLNRFTYGGTRERTVTCIGSYYVPEGATGLETGVLYMTSSSPTATFDRDTLIAQGSGVVKRVTPNHTDSNQFVYNITRTKNTAFSIAMVVYITYTYGGNEVTTYSRMATSNFNGSAETVSYTDSPAPTALPA